MGINKSIIWILAILILIAPVLADSVTFGNLNVTENVSAKNFFGNGATLSNLNVTGNLSWDYILKDNIDASGYDITNGGLFKAYNFSGNVLSIYSVLDPAATISYLGTSGTALEVSRGGSTGNGIAITTSASGMNDILGTSNSWYVRHNGEATFQNVTANTYFGDGSQLTGINTNVTGPLSISASSGTTFEVNNTAFSGGKGIKINVAGPTENDIEGSESKWYITRNGQAYFTGDGSSKTSLTANTTGGGYAAEFKGGKGVLIDDNLNITGISNFGDTAIISPLSGQALKIETQTDPGLTPFVQILNQQPKGIFEPIILAVQDDYGVGGLFQTINGTYALRAVVSNGGIGGALQTQGLVSFVPADSNDNLTVEMPSYFDNITADYYIGDGSQLVGISDNIGKNFSHRTTEVNPSSENVTGLTYNTIEEAINYVKDNTSTTEQNQWVIKIDEGQYIMSTTPELVGTSNYYRIQGSGRPYEGFKYGGGGNNYGSGTLIGGTSGDMFHIGNYIISFTLDNLMLESNSFSGAMFGANSTGSVGHFRIIDSDIYGKGPQKLFDDNLIVQELYVKGTSFVSAGVNYASIMPPLAQFDDVNFQEDYGSGPTQSWIINRSRYGFDNEINFKNSYIHANENNWINDVSPSGNNNIWFYNSIFEPGNVTVINATNPGILTVHLCDSQLNGNLIGSNVAVEYCDMQLGNVTNEVTFTDKVNIVTTSETALFISGAPMILRPLSSPLFSIGSNANASADSSGAIGLNSVASSVGCLAIAGEQAHCSGLNSLSLGLGSNVTGTASTVIATSSSSPPVTQNFVIGLMAPNGGVGINKGSGIDVALDVNGTINVNENINLTTTGNCLYGTDGGSICFNSTCVIIASPNGLTTSEVCN